MEFMALKISTPSSNNFHPFNKITKIDGAFSATRSSIIKMNPSFCRITTVFIAKQDFGVIGDDIEKEGIEDKTTPYHNSTIKESLYDALQGINRGIFGVQSEKKAEIEKLVMQLETQNPTPQPTKHLDKMAGKWMLVYSTITILGAKRTKLGLRDFITLGDFLQIIDISEGKAVNVIEFSARGLNLLKGQLQIEATFKIASKSKVEISYESSSITPEQLMNVFKKNYELLLSIFNPEGWLDITYVDGTLRIGRDDKGNIFILERSN